ncbi:Lrp/AsnC family transcriptional regulator [Ornithinimicrobium faecis]|uniref:Lrp/AsnC family transcriptional regulator n=1 Tax=Ornithinimicrobium faecis TaxID=2934158 RepID=UPI00211979CB|nr:AsnC family transcriptional regulator [Ornithinimicrobium sp. HY1745]
MSSSPEQSRVRRPHEGDAVSDPAHYVADDIDRLIIGELQANGRAQWADIAERVSVSAPTVVRRGQALLASGAVRVGLLPNPVSQVPGRLTDIRLVCDPGRHLDVAEAMVAIPEIRFLASVTGPFDLIGELAYPRDLSEQVKLIERIQQIPGVHRCTTNPHMHTYKWSQRWLRQTMGDALPQASNQPPTCDPSHMDDVDLRMIEVMRADGRVSVRKVAAQLDLNESTVRRRLDTMLEHGCVQVMTLVSAKAVGYEAEILLDVEVEPQRLNEVAALLAENDGVRYIAASLSSPTLFCEMVLPDAERVFTFLTEELAHMDGVQRWQAGSELLTFKRGFLESPWWREAVGRD